MSYIEKLNEETMRPKYRNLTAAVCGMLMIGIPVLSLAANSSPALFSEKTISWQVPYKPVDFVQSVDGKMLFVLTENNRVLIYEPNGTLKGSIPVDKGVTAIDTDARGENIYLIDSEKNTFTSLSVDFIVDIDTAGSPFKGAADAPVTIAVFSDFE